MWVKTKKNIFTFDISTLQVFLKKAGACYIALLVFLLFIPNFVFPQQPEDFQREFTQLANKLNCKTLDFMIEQSGYTSLGTFCDNSVNIGTPNNSGETLYGKLMTSNVARSHNEVVTRILQTQNQLTPQVINLNTFNEKINLLIQSCKLELDRLGWSNTTKNNLVDDLESIVNSHAISLTPSSNQTPDNQNNNRMTYQVPDNSDKNPGFFFYIITAVALSIIIITIYHFFNKNITEFINSVKNQFNNNDSSAETDSPVSHDAKSHNEDFLKAPLPLEKQTLQVNTTNNETKPFSESYNSLDEENRKLDQKRLELKEKEKRIANEFKKLEEEKQKLKEAKVLEARNRQSKQNKFQLKRQSTYNISTRKKFTNKGKIQYFLETPDYLNKQNKEGGGYFWDHKKSKEQKPYQSNFILYLEYGNDRKGVISIIEEPSVYKRLISSFDYQLGPIAKLMSNIRKGNNIKTINEAIAELEDGKWIVKNINRMEIQIY